MSAKALRDGVFRLQAPGNVHTISALGEGSGGFQRRA